MASFAEKARVAFWIVRNYPIYKYKCWKTRNERQRLQILTSEETVKHILSTKCSIARFGDGELQMIAHFLNKGKSEDFNVDTFQSYDSELGRRLHEVLSTQVENLLIGLPYQLKNSTISDLFNQLFWDREWLSRRHIINSVISPNRVFGDTNFTRFYMGRKDILDYPSYITLLQNIWANRSVLLVEGEFSRLGVGNSFFDSHAKSIRRVICPPKNAFGQYENILKEVELHAKKDDLILLALRHTATILTYDLTALGYQAIDLGHIDIEYEWYRMGAKEKVAIPNKYVNEVEAGRISEVSDIDNIYNSEIVARITSK